MHLTELPLWAEKLLGSICNRRYKKTFAKKGVLPLNLKPRRIIMPTLMDIVNDLAAALTAAETAEDSLEASAGGDSTQTEALKNAIARFRARLDKNRETQAALEGELAQRTTAFTLSAQSYAGKVAGLKTQVDPGGSLAGSVQAAQAEALRLALSLPNVPALDPFIAAVTAADSNPSAALTTAKTTLTSARTALIQARSEESARRSQLETIEARLLFLASDAARVASGASKTLASLTAELALANTSTGSARNEALMRAVVYLKDLTAQRKRLIDPINPSSAETPFDVNNGDANALRDTLLTGWTAARDALTAAAGARFQAEKAVFAAEVGALQAESKWEIYQSSRVELAAAAASTVLGP
jgi:hypothetical protein